MLRVVAVLAALAVGATAVWAQNAAGIAARKEAMKAFGGAAKGPGAMNKGDAPFELPKVQASLKTIEETAAKAKGLFGDDTKTGETDALPAAFEKKPDLMARFDKIGRRCQGRRRRHQGRGHVQGRVAQGRGQLRRLPQGIPQAQAVSR